MQPQENSMRKYYTEQAWIARAQLRDQWEHAPADAREKWHQTCQQLFTEIEAALDLDPASETAQALTKRWLQLVESTSGGNEGIRAGSLEAFKDHLNWPPAQQDALLAGFGLDPQDRTGSMHRLEAVVQFIGRTIGHKVQSNLRGLY